MRFLNRLRRRPHRDRCEALTRSGRPCKAAPLEGKPWCSLHTPGNAQRLASLRWSQPPARELDSSSVLDEGRDNVRRPPERDSYHLLAGPHTREVAQQTKGRTTADLIAEIDEAYPRPPVTPVVAKPPKPEPSPIAGFPLEPGENLSDYRTRHALHQQEIWKAKQEKAGYNPPPLMPRLWASPEQWVG